MSAFIFSVFLTLLLSVLSAFGVLRVGLLDMNFYELKRRAKLGDVSAKRLFPIISLRQQLFASILVCQTTVFALIILLLSTKTSPPLVLLFSVFLGLLFGELLPRLIVNKFGLTAVALMATPVDYLLSWTGYITLPLGKILAKWDDTDSTLIHSREQLFEIFDRDSLAKDSDVSETEIGIARHALTFSDLHVRDVMTPRRIVVSVGSKESVGPILLNELHKSGASRFPVTDDKSQSHFVGTLYLKDLVGSTIRGTVADLMRKDVFYCHEEDRLDHALQAFLNTNHHLLIVVNTFEEFVGILTLEDVIEEVIGYEIVDEFDQHADLRAVAKKLAQKDKKLHAHL